MKKLVSFTIALMAVSYSFAKISFAIDYALFQTPSQGSYIEFYMSIDGESIVYAQQENQLFQANIEVTYIIEKGEEIIAFDKFQINSPYYKVEDIKLNLLDLKRLPVKDGNFKYTVKAKDLINGTEAEITQDLRKIKTIADKFQFSEIQLGDDLSANTESGAFVKSGYNITPNVTHAYGKSRNKLVLYVEAYNAQTSLGDSADYLLDIHVKDKLTGKITADLRSLKRMKAIPLSPVIQSFNIENLPSGEYDLIIEARNRKNELITSTTTSFVRSNPNLNTLEVVGTLGTFVDSLNDIHVLKEYILSLFPISSSVERQWSENQLKYADLEYMQRFFLNFWKERNPLDPELAWLEYKEKVELVDREFGYGNVNGYSTERGRVYLQYGAPDAVQNVKYDSDNHPYSIWQYYKLNDFVDRKFVFYSPSNEMLGYEIAHSNVIGEINNPQWQRTINKKTNSPRTTRGIDEDSDFNRVAKDLYDNPR